MTGGGTTKPAVNGIIPWETVAKGTGLQTIKGRIELNTEQGLITRDWKFEYMVGTTGASMALDKMNVMYIGVDNPVTVAAAGYSVEDVSLAIPGAKVTGEKGHFTVVVDKVDPKLEVSINAKTKEGPLKKVGSMIVRVKKIPNPIAMVGGIASGAMPASSFRLQVAPAAKLDNFDFDAKFAVLGFTFGMSPKGKDYVGPINVYTKGGVRFNDNKDIKTAIERAKPGDRVYLENVRVVGPDKIERVLPTPIVLSLN
jgi:hypothetical protein